MTIKIKKNKALICCFVQVFLIINIIVVIPINALALISGEAIKTSVSNTHSAVVLSDGSLWLWGDNYFGEIGDGTTTDRLAPVKVLEGVKDVSVGHGSSYAIKNDNTLWAWGGNGIIGTGIINVQLTPVKILDNVTLVSAGSGCGCAIKTDGSLWAWGYDGDGFVGDTSGINRLSPVKAMENVVFADMGVKTGFAITNDRKLWACGNNAYGQIGDGTVNDCPVPKVIMDNVKSVSIGSYTTLALQNDGLLWAWGSNSGNYGNGTYDISYSPVQILADVNSIYSYSTHSAMIDNNGNLWMWGRNTTGQLGDGTYTNKLSPIRVMDNVLTTASGGGNTSLTIKLDGSLWAWGYNRGGEIGDGTVIDKNYPVKIVGSNVQNAIDGILLSTSFLSPLFNTNHENYTISLPENVETITITPVKGDASATVTINDQPVSNINVNLPLAGRQKVKISGTLDGVTKNYYITVNRWPYCDVEPTYPTTDGLTIQNGARLISLSRFGEVFGYSSFLDKEDRKEMVLNSNMPGTCFGLSLSTMGFNKELLLPEWYDSGSSCANDISKTNSSLLATIDRLFISQFSAQFSEIYVTEKPETFVARYSELEGSSAEPCLVVMEDNSGGAHAVVAYDTDTITFGNGDSGLLVHLYDPNYPADQDNEEAYVESHLLINLTDQLWTYEKQDSSIYLNFYTLTPSEIDSLIQPESDRMKGNTVSNLDWFFESSTNAALQGYSYAVIQPIGTYTIGDENGGTLVITDEGLVYGNISDYYFLPSLSGNDDGTRIIAIKADDLTMTMTGQSPDGYASALAGDGYLFTSYSPTGSPDMQASVEDGKATVTGSGVSGMATCIDNEEERNISVQNTSNAEDTLSMDISTDQFKVSSQNGFNGMLEIYNNIASSDTMVVEAIIEAGQGLNLDLVLSNTDTVGLAAYKDTDGDGDGDLALQPVLENGVINITELNTEPKITGVSTVSNNTAPVIPTTTAADINSVLLTRNGVPVTGWGLGDVITLSGTYELTVTDFYGLTVNLDFVVVPQTPSILAVPTSYNSIEVRWSEVDGVANYEVYRATSATSNYSLISTTASTSYTNTNLATGTTYYYKVRAYDGSESHPLYSDYSDPVSATPVPATPAIILASTSYTGIKVSWNAAAGASGYEVYRSTTKNGTYALKYTSVSGSAGSWTNTGLTVDKVYYYQVRAYRTVSGVKVYGAYSAINSTAPGRVSMAVSRVSSTSAKITWTAVSGSAGYEVWRGTTKNGTYSLKYSAKATVTSWTNTGLVTGKAYYYQVRAWRMVSGKKVYGQFSAINSVVP